MLLALWRRCCRTQAVTYKYMLPSCVRQRLARAQADARSSGFLPWCRPEFGVFLFGGFRFMAGDALD